MLSRRWKLDCCPVVASFLHKVEILFLDSRSFFFASICKQAWLMKMFARCMVSEMPLRVVFNQINPPPWAQEGDAVLSTPTWTDLSTKLMILAYTVISARSFRPRESRGFVRSQPSNLVEGWMGDAWCTSVQLTVVSRDSACDRARKSDHSPYVACRHRLLDPVKNSPRSAPRGSNNSPTSPSSDWLGRLDVKLLIWTVLA